MVFGCGGDRDRGKRPLMGEIAARDADLAIVTSDNPRTEDPAAIVGMILEGVRRTGARRAGARAIWRARDARVSHARSTGARRSARPAAAARAGDVLLIAGKGHEDYQILGTTKVHFDDREEAAAALRRASDRATTRRAPATRTLRLRGRARWAARCVQAGRARRDVRGRGASTAARSAPGQLFFALPGERVDGFDFAGAGGGRGRRRRRGARGARRAGGLRRRAR